MCMKRCLRGKKNCLSKNFGAGIACAAGGISVAVLHCFGGGAVYEGWVYKSITSERENPGRRSRMKGGYTSQLQVRGKIPPAGIFPLTSHGINSAAKNVSRAQECHHLRGLERAWRSVGSFS